MEHVFALLEVVGTMALAIPLSMFAVGLRRALLNKEAVGTVRRRRAR